MSFYQWYYDIPSPMQGIVLAEGETEAHNKVMEEIRLQLGYCSGQLLRVKYLAPVTDEICYLEEM